MNKKDVKLVFEQLGSQAFPDDLNPWPSVQRRLELELPEKNKGRVKKKGPGRKANPYKFALIGSLVIIALILIMSLPETKSLVKALGNYIGILDEDQNPPIKNPENYATPTFASTFAATIIPAGGINATETPTVQVNSAPESCYVNPEGYYCKVAWGERKAGFDAKEFPTILFDFDFVGASNPRPGELILEYKSIYEGGGTLKLIQSNAGGINSIFIPSPPDAIEEVMVGDNKGEFVVGMWIVSGNPPQSEWSPGLRYRLRWVEDEVMYEIFIEGYPYPDYPYENKEVLIEMALSLVYEPILDDAPRLEFLENLDEVREIAEFEVVEPKILPLDFDFKQGNYDLELSQLRLYYTPLGSMIGSDSHIEIVEIPIDKVHLTPDLIGLNLKGEEVDINGYTGVYTSGSESYWVTWETNDLRIILHLYSSEDWYGATFTKEQILEFARSIE